MSEARKGFSLVLSLTIMALLVLVVLTIAGFLNLESRLAANRMDLSKAQLNAVASARLAIGHLQMLAGPDQRVTARADIFDGGATNSYLSMPALTAAAQSSFLRKRNWTGVWCTGGADSSKPRDWNPLQPDERIFLGWLVSPQATKSADPTLNDETQLPFLLPDSSLANSTGVGSKGKPLITGTSLAAMITPWVVPRFIPLLDLGTLNYSGRATYAAGADPDKVELPPAPLPGPVVGGSPTLLGNYAWWVGDNGMKARYNLPDPATLTSTGAELPGLTDFARSFRTQFGRQAVELMGTGVVSARPFKDVPALWDLDVKAAIAASSANTALLPRTTSRLMLRNWARWFGGTASGAAMEAAVGDALSRYYHDATHVSYGVLSDTLNGGLRRDLSVAFELPFTEYASLAEFNDSPGENGDRNGYATNWSAGFNLANTMRITAANTPSSKEWMNTERKLGFLYELPIPASLYTGRSQAQSNPVANSSPALIRGPTWDVLRNYYRLYKREYEQIAPAQRRGQANPTADAWLARGAEPFSFAIGDSSVSTSYRGHPGYYAFRGNAAMMSRKNAAGGGPYYPEQQFIALPNLGSHPNAVSGAGPIPQHTSMKLAPNVVRTGFVFNLVWQGTTAADAKLGISMDPRVTIHNPYNVPLEFNGLGMTVGKWYALTFNFQRSDTLAQIGWMELQPTFFYGRCFTFRIFNNGGTLSNPGTVAADANVGPNGTVRLEPGELRTFCASSETTAQTGEVVYNNGTGTGEVKNIPGVFNYGTTGQSLVYRFPTPPDPSTFGGTRAVRVTAGFGYRADNPSADTTGSYLWETGQFDFHLAHNQLDDGTTDPTMPARTWYGIANNPELDMADEHLIHRIQFLSRSLATRTVTSADIPPNAPVPVPFAMVDIKARGWDDSGTTNQRADTASPLFINHRAQLLDYRSQDGDANGPAGWTVEFNNANAVVSQYEMTGARNNSFWGKSFASGNGGQTKVILYQVPTRPLLSLAGLGSVDYTHIDLQPGLTVGNSYCHPSLPDADKLLDWPVSSGGSVNGSPSLTSNWGYVRQPRYDAAWASNQALYDRYFFSGAFANELSSYTPASGSLAKVDASQPDTLEAAFASLQAGTNVLANKRMVWLPGAGLVAADFRNPAKTAKALLHDGTFNVNSTSKDAWRAFLAGLRGQKLPGATKAATDLTPFSRFDKVSADHDSSNAAARFRALTDAELDTLADQIVNQVRTRGPFMCLADFVNRRLLKDTPSSNGAQLKGALQAAIDAAGINGAAPYNATWSADANRHPMAKALSTASNPSGNSAQAALGATGMLLQSDILNAAGSSLSARSDTFTIRAYGESVDTLGKPLVGAWIELTVQRMPEMIVATNENEPNVLDAAYRSQPANASASNPFMEKFKVNPVVNKANRFLGRRFKVIGVRWLAPNEV